MLSKIILSITSLFSQFLIKLIEPKFNIDEKLEIHDDTFFYKKGKEKIKISDYKTHKTYFLEDSLVLEVRTNDERIYFFLPEKDFYLGNFHESESPVIYKTNNEIYMIITDFDTELRESANYVYKLRQGVLDKIYTIDTDNKAQVITNKFYETEDFILFAGSKNKNEASDYFDNLGEGFLYFENLKTHAIKKFSFEDEIIDLYFDDENYYCLSKNKVYILGKSFEPKGVHNYNSKEFKFFPGNFFLYEEGEMLKLINLNLSQILFSIKGALNNGFINVENHKYLSFKYDEVFFYLNNFKQKPLLEKNEENEKNYFGYTTKTFKLGDVYFEEICEYSLVCSVKPGRIYPLNYQLLFNAEGVLNNQKIYKNHLITLPGEYTLTLTGINKTEVINFFVAEDQINYKDLFKPLPKNVQTFHDILKVKYTFTSEKLQIKKIILDTETIEDFLFENKELIFVLNPVLPGYGEIRVVSILYREENTEKVLFLNDKIKYVKLIPKPKISLRLSDKRSEATINYTFFNQYANIRGILVVSSENKQSFPVCTQKIDLTSFKGEARVFLIYDEGLLKLARVYLFSLFTTGKYHFDIIRDEVLDSKISLSVNLLKSSSLEKVVIKEKTVYQKLTISKKYYFLLPIFIFLGVGACFGLSLLIKNKLKKPKNK